jgi:glutamate carboxypeptidase
MASVQGSHEMASRRALTAASAASAVVDRELAPILRRIEELVRIDSGGDAPVGRERVADLIGEWAAEAGCDIEFLAGEGGTAMVATLSGYGQGRIVLLGHHDTVFPAGTAAERPFVLREKTALGPGVADMKGGLVLALAALSCLAEGERPFATVELHSVADEESRPHGAFKTLDRVRDADAVLVLECARGNGDLVLERKSQCNLRLIARGRSAHAGTHPEQGRSALLALCREILRCDALNGMRDGLTVTVGTFHSGMAFGVVPDEAEAEIDLRAWVTADVAWALEQVGAASVHEGVSFETEGVSLWPAMAADARSRHLYEVAATIAQHLGIPAGARRSGGTSDGCWTAAAGVPTLDGLGPVGGHDHSPDEYIEVASFPERCGLLVGLVTALGLDRNTVAE